MNFHEATNLFPLLEGKEFEDLVTDIRQNGQLEPIWTYQGEIVDGRNRYRACKELGIEPKVKEWNGKDSLISFIISLNLHRRHLNESQRAMVAARLGNMQKGRPRKNASIEAFSQTNVAGTLNVSRSNVQRAQKVQQKAIPEIIKRIDSGGLAVSDAVGIVDLPVKKQAEIIRKVDRKEAHTLREAKQQIRKKNLKNPELPRGTYDVILADPPWPYNFSKSESRAIENQYPTMSLEEIKALKIPGAENAVLFLWATAPKLLEALEVMRAWDFIYKTCAVWDKEKIGMGYWFRGQHELLLIGTKGNFSPPAPEDRVSSIIRVPRGKHSEKPVVLYEIIERMFPRGAYLEMFGRKKREKWTVYGNEVE